MLYDEVRKFSHKFQQDSDEWRKDIANLLELAAAADETCSLPPAQGLVLQLKRVIDYGRNHQYSTAQICDALDDELNKRSNNDEGFSQLQRLVNNSYRKGL